MKGILHYLLAYKNQLLILSISIFLICCGTTSTTTGTTTGTSTSTDPLQPSATDLTAAQSHWQGTTMDQLTAGYTIYTTKCQDEDCHGLKKPQKFTVDEWKGILPKMGRKAHLDSLQYVEVYRYILAKREVITGEKMQ